MNTYVKTFSSEFEKKIRKFFEEKNFEFEEMQYAFYKAKQQNCNAVFYKSGKFVIQGKEIEKLVSEFETYMQIENNINSVNQDTTSSDYDCYIGTDESGKGDYFGPLVIAGVMVDETNKQDFINLGIKDSKRLNDTTIKKFAAHIKNNSIFSIVTITPEKYNELYAKFNNLNKLLAWGHARAIENILAKKKCEYALSDQFGDESLIKNALMKAGRTIKLEQRHRAESDIAVACASVIARAEFVLRMEDMQKKYQLSFSKGASDKVIEEANNYCKKYGREDLNKVTKLHFKTTNQLSY